jgi:hypothetical protein
MSVHRNLVGSSALFIFASSASAQDKPWELFLDTQSTSACDVVNAENAELVVLSSTGQLVIVSETDVTLQDTFVDAQGFVFFEGEPAGTIAFADDGDGLRSIWWMTLTGNVVEVSPFSGQPSATDSVPSDFDDVPCDACEFWDDRSLCETPPPPPITLPLCGRNIELPIASAAVALIAGRFRRRTGD